MLRPDKAGTLDMWPLRMKQADVYAPGGHPVGHPVGSRQGNGMQQSDPFLPSLGLASRCVERTTRREMGTLKLLISATLETRRCAAGSVMLVG